MARRGPFGAQVFAHTERTRHLVDLELARECVGQRRTVNLPYVAGNSHVAARNRTRTIARGEIALVSSHKLIALLLEVKHVIRAAGAELDVHVPAAGEIGSGRLRLFRARRRALDGKNLV